MKYVVVRRENTIAQTEDSIVQMKGVVVEEDEEDAAEEIMVA